MNNINRIVQYIYHYISARYTLGYNVHSPYLYDFTRNVIYENNPYYIFQSIEEERKKLLTNKRIIYVEDFGTQPSSERIISDIAQKTLATPDEGQLLFRIANYQKANKILELGTAFGISTAYLAAHDSRCNVTTFEGSNEIANIATLVWDNLHITQQIKLIRGNINETLPLYIKDQKQFDIIYFDANHTYQDTLDYFNICLPHRHENTIFIFDDIYYNQDMTNAWKEIQRSQEVKATIDLFHLGLVFFNPYLIKKNYKMRF